MKKLPKKAEKAIVARPEWLDDPNVILFVRDEPEPAFGQLGVNLVEPISQPILPRWAGSVFGRAKNEVRHDWEKVMNQIHFLLEDVSQAAKGYELTELTFNLGFSGEGSLGFIAKAGATAGISVKFTKKSVGAVSAPGLDS